MIKILLLDFRNSKWRIQVGNEKFEKCLNFAQNLYTEVFEGADHDLAISNFLLKNGHDDLWNCPNAI